MQLAYIGIGSNLAQPIQQVRAAIKALKTISQTTLSTCSSLYCTKPWGVTNQPDFINCVVALKTKLSPLILLRHLQHIENQQGRVRAERNGARIIDLDILLYGNEIMSSLELTIPHIYMREREFVLVPLAEIAPDLYLPTGESITQLRAACPPYGIHCLEENACAE